MVKSVVDANFQEETNSGLVLVDFWAPWCGPCRMQSPIIDQLDEEIGDKVTFVKVNVDEASQTASQHSVMSIPTLMIKKDGVILETLVGLHGKAQLESILEKYV